MARDPPLPRPSWRRAPPPPPPPPGGGCCDSARKQIGGLDTEELRRFDEVLRAPARRALNLATYRRPRDTQMIREPPPSRV